MQCTFGRGHMTFTSDNLSTIAILRDVLGKEITRRKLKVDMATEPNDESVAHTLRTLHPKLEYQMNLAKKVHLAIALKVLYS